MSRRKQEKPQPRKNLIRGETDIVHDILTCGVCQKTFFLADIVRFIQHKVQYCNKENSCLGLFEDSEDSQDPGAPVSVKKEDPDTLPEEPLVSSSTLIKKTLIAKDTSTATSNDGNSEPRNYVCSTCKESLSSAWALIQHVQTLHGLSICVDNTSSPSEKPAKPVESLSALNHPFSLRAPLLERQMDPTPLFPRNSSQELRIDLSSKSSNGLTNGPCVTPPPLLEPPQNSQCEPMQDYYSQRLRVLAGATSPNASSTSRKLLQPTLKSVFNNTKTSPVPSTPPESLASPSDKVQSSNLNSSSSSTTSEHPTTPTAKNRLCEYCGKSFQFKSNLIVHRRSHTGEKPFKCHICNHACTQASKLKRHMKTHRGKRLNFGKTPKSTEDSNDKDAKSEGNASSDGKSKDNEKQTNGDGELDSEEEDVDDEEIDVECDVELEEEEINVDDSMKEDEDDVLRENGEGKLVIDHPADDDNMVAEDLSKKPIRNGTPTENGKINNKKDDLSDSSEKKVQHSVISEIMEKIGFGRIPTYNEAYRQALKESSYRNSTKHDRSSPGTDGNASSDAGSHYGYDMPSFHHLERPPRDGTRSAGQSPLSFGSGLLDTFDQSISLKRIKLEEHMKDKEREGSLLYAGVWFPRVEHSQSPYRDLYGLDGIANHRSKPSSESALSNNAIDNNGSRPGPSSSLCAMALSKPKDQPTQPRRNDTCEYCGKVFKNCSNLTVHRRSHTGEKPYKCELCSYACAQSSKLTRHMKTHGRLGKDVYRCRFCDMPFSVPSTLEKHMRKCVVSQSGGSPYLMSERDSDSKEMTT